MPKAPISDGYKMYSTITSKIRMIREKLDGELTSSQRIVWLKRLKYYLQERKVYNHASMVYNRMYRAGSEVKK